MSAALERVISVRQTSMAATALPLELQQQIFSYLDTKTFYSARKVCKWWHFASTEAVPLARQLRRLPILPPVEASDSDPAELQHLFEEAARTFMLGVKAERKHDQPGSLTRASKMGFPINPRVAATSNGGRTVTLNGRQIALFDTSSDEATVIAQRPLNDLKETVGSGPWLKVQANTYHELALSSDGNLLAVAQERTIQIYDLLSDPDSFTVNEYVSSATGHYICGLDFEQNDHVLRVRLSGKGTVLYLGTPPSPALREKGEKATLEHWKSKAGLKHTFLDSALMQLPNTSEVEANEMARVSGVQLLHCFDGGFLFAGQKHGGGESSHYILGHIETHAQEPLDVLTSQPERVTVLARLESFLSSWDFTLESSSEGSNGLGVWENMPSAHEHHPRFAMAPKGTFLALAERDKKRIRPAPLTQLFVYRLPDEQEMHEILAQNQAERSKQSWTSLDGFLEKLDRQQQQHARAYGAKSEDKAPAKNIRSSKYTVPRIPLCLSTLQNDVTELEFSSVDVTTCTISAATVECKRTWLLQES